VRIAVDRERCIGSGSCVWLEPAVFDQDKKDGRVVLRTTEPGPVHRENVREAVGHCPTEAVYVVEG
jgi:ferredoxin